MSCQNFHHKRKKLNLLVRSGPVNEQPAAKRPKHKPVVEDTEAKWLYGYHWARRPGTETTMPYMFCLVMLGLVVPLNTACVERGFSHHGIIKNKLRTRLKIVHVDSLLRVKLLCHDYKGFAYTRAMDLHHSMKSGLISKLASDVDRLQFADFEEDMAGEDFVDFSPPSESDASDECGFIFSESDEECQEVQDIQQEIPSTLYPLQC